MHRERIHLAIADDHIAIRQALKTTLSLNPEFHFIFEANNGQELLECLSISQPDVLLLDIKMPGTGGIDALKMIHQQYPAIKVLILTAFIDELYVAQCLEYGICGYLVKSMSIDDISNAIKVVYRNEVYFSNLIGNALLRKYFVSHNKQDNILPHFSHDELQILEMIKDEKTTEEISSIMDMSKRSIELKRDNMRKKVNVKTIGGLLIYALKRGLID